MSEAIDWFTAHQALVGFVVAAICVALKVYIIKTCPSHPHYRGPGGTR